MPTVNAVLACPVCQITTKTDGSSFSGLRSVTLHIVGKGIGLNDSHRSWIYELVPGADLNRKNMNKIGDQIEFYVSEALEELEEKVSPDEGPLVSILDSLTIDVPAGRSDNEREQYIKAYKFIWTIETRLHRFVAAILSDLKEGQWWTAFPNDLQQKCLDRAQQDKHRSPFGCYIDFLDFGDIIKHNREVFADAFSRLGKDYKDPRSEFYRKLGSINALRIRVMHPVRQVAPNQDDLAMLEQFAEFVNIFVSEE